MLRSRLEVYAIVFCSEAFAMERQITGLAEKPNDSFLVVTGSLASLR